MNNLSNQDKNSSSFLENFRQISIQGHYDYIDFYARYFNEIHQLAFNEYLEIKLVYLNSLLVLRKSYIFHITCDQFIEEILFYHTMNDFLKSMYLKSLQLKAKMYREDKLFEKALKIYLEVNRLKPNNSIIKRDMFLLLYKMEQIKNLKWIKFIILALLFTLSISGIQLLTIQTEFYLMKNSLFFFRNFFFSSAVCILVVTNLISIRKIMGIIQRY